MASYGTTTTTNANPAVSNITKGDPEEVPDEGPSWKFWTRQRYVVAFMAFLGFFNVYALRVNLSVAIVAMTTVRNVTLQNGTVVEEREFAWDQPTRGLVLSSFFYGYLVTQIPGGWLAARVGGNRLFGVGLAATALLTLLTPPVARAGVEWLIVLRIIEGLFEGVTFPCIHAVWARWAPPAERSRLATIAFSGSYAGTVFSFPFGSFLAAKVGWESIFYVFGVMGLTWYAAWVYLVKEGPEHDPRISAQELQYIQRALANVPDPKGARQPWGQFLRSMPVWAIVAAHFCENWGFYTLLTQLPSFMKDTLHFDLEQTGFLSALPYLGLAGLLQAAGHLADWLRAGRMSTTAVRKLFNCTAFLSQTVFMMAAAYVHATLWVVVCLTIAVSLGGLAWSAFSVNHLDIAPQYASVLMGLSNTVATLPGMISPHITGYIVRNKTEEEWRIVFGLSSAIYLAGAVFYGVFASGERQPWAKDNVDEMKEMDRNQPGAQTNQNHAYTNTSLDHDAPDAL